MRVISNTLIQKLREKRSSGISYKKIAKELEMSPASVMKYCQNIKLSQRAQFLLDLNAYKNRQFFSSKFAVEKTIAIPKLDENMASILGHVLFDGSLSPQDGRYMIRYLNASSTLVDNFDCKMALLFGLSPKKSTRQGVNFVWHQSCFYSKQVCDLLLTYSPSFSTSKGVGIPSKILTAPENVKMSFLKAFWDDEGSISANGTLSASSVSEQTIDDLIVVHRGLGLGCSKIISKTKDCFEIYIKRSYANFKLFKDKIGFTDSVVVRGKNMGCFKKDVLAVKIGGYGNV